MEKDKKDIENSINKEKVEPLEFSYEHKIISIDEDVEPIPYDGPLWWGIEELKEQARIRGIKIDDED